MNNFNFNGNWVDLLIIIILFYFLIEGLRLGLWILLSDFLSFFLSLIISLRFYQVAADFLRINFSLSHSLSNAIGFLLVALISEFVLGNLLNWIISLIPERLWKYKISRVMGIIPAFGEGIIIVAFGLTLIVGLPISPKIKADLTESKIGSYILKQTSGAERKINEIFGGVIEDSLTYLTIKPGSGESVPLNVNKYTLSVDEKSEAEMFKLVNGERKKAGLAELVWLPEAVPVARAHAQDMWERKYFSHVSPDGEDVGDRLRKGKVKYRLAGENLALAPTLQTAHNGLMNSEGHRANILEQRYKKIAIGVIDNGVYGKMFVQIFTD